MKADSRAELLEIEEIASTLDTYIHCPKCGELQDSDIPPGILIEAGTLMLYTKCDNCKQRISIIAEIKSITTWNREE